MTGEGNSAADSACGEHRAVEALRLATPARVLDAILIAKPVVLVLVPGIHPGQSVLHRPDDGVWLPGH